jgi:hypothetical protein
MNRSLVGLASSRLTARCGAALSLNRIKSTSAIQTGDAIPLVPQL